MPAAVKGGGIKTAVTPEEVERVADQILGMTLITHQTGPKARRSTKSWWNRPRTSPRSSTWASSRIVAWVRR